MPSPKKFAATFCLMFFMLAARAQDFTPTKWKFTGISIDYSFVTQELSDLGYADIYGLVRDRGNFQIEMNDFKKMAYSKPIFDVDRLGINLTLQKPSANPKWQHEWQIGLSVDLYSEVLVEYENRSQSAPDRDYRGWCLLNNRVTLGLNRLVRYGLNNRFSFHGGLGVNLGTSFNDKVLIFEDRDSFDTDIHTKARTTQFLVFNGLLGGKVRLTPKISLTSTFSYGFGRHMRNFKVKNDINQSGSLTFGAKLNLGK